MPITVLVVNPTSNTYEFMVRGRRFVVPAHRFEPDPVRLTVREDCLGALFRTLEKRGLRCGVLEEMDVFRDAESEDVTVTVSDSTATEETHVTITETEEPPDGELKDAPPDKSEFFTACKAQKAGEGAWNVTLPDGQELTIEADHHKRAKEMAYEMLYGADE